MASRWLSGTPEDIENLILYSGTQVVKDGDGLPVMLFQSEWHINAAMEKNPKLTFSPVARGEAVNAPSTIGIDCATRTEVGAQ